MNYKALHYSILALDILYFIWFILCLLLLLCADAMSGMSHSYRNVEYSRRRRYQKIGYLIAIIGNIFGFSLLFFPSAYNYYQIVIKVIICVSFFKVYLKIGVDEDWYEKLLQILEATYVVMLILHIVELVFWLIERNNIK